MSQNPTSASILQTAIAYVPSCKPKEGLWVQNENTVSVMVI